MLVSLMPNFKVTMEHLANLRLPLTWATCSFHKEKADYCNTLKTKFRFYKRDVMRMKCSLGELDITVEYVNLPFL